MKREASEGREYEEECEIVKCRDSDGVGEGRSVGGGDGGRDTLHF